MVRERRISAGPAGGRGGTLEHRALLAAPWFRLHRKGRAGRQNWARV